MTEADQSEPERAAAIDVESLVAEVEALAADRARLAEVPYAVRTRLLAACERLAVPNAVELRLLRKALRSKDNQERRERDSRALLTASLRRERSVDKIEHDQVPLHALPARTVSVPPLSTLLRIPNQASGDSSIDGGDAGHAAGEPESNPSSALLTQPRTCYVCKAPYTQVHSFYHSMCCACGDFNYHKRDELCDLRGRVALVTGGRVKIGQEIVRKLLRCGARVIVTTRFAADAARRYAAIPDFASFADRLTIYGLDLRHTPSVERFCEQLLHSEQRLDFLVNNACQTVRRPAGYYAHLMDREREVAAHLSPAARAVLGQAPSASEALGTGEVPAARNDHLFAAELSQLVVDESDEGVDRTLFPEHAYDVDEQQIDLRRKNSWRLRLAEVSTPELIEVQLVNAVAPFVLNARLKPLMERVATRDKHIVNVSAVEGQFSRGTKTDKHPHTNMAKAALNMMTRTSANDYLRSGIHMNAVDTGWITDEDPVEHALRKEREGFQPPLDSKDGAARVLDPIISGFRSGHHITGMFLKDYAVADW